MRVSDADRAQIADRLAKHYSDGRLSQAEFDERLDKAMHATTVADLSGLLADLPGDPVPLPTEPRAPGDQRDLANEQREQREPRRQRRPAPVRVLRLIALFVAFLVIAALAARAIAELFFVCLVVGVVVLLVKLSHGSRRRRGGS